MKLYRASQDGHTLCLATEPLAADDFPAGCVFDKVEREVPNVDGRLELWQGDDGLSYPHLHFLCPRCSTEHNVDLHPDDPNPRFACCDTCGWDSIVWIRWNKQ